VKVIGKVTREVAGMESGEAKVDAAVVMVTTVVVMAVAGVEVAGMSMARLVAVARLAMTMKEATLPHA